jgi:hypothetical protein
LGHNHERASTTVVEPKASSIAANAQISRIISRSCERNMYRFAPGSSTIFAVGTPASKSPCHFSSTACLAATSSSTPSRSTSLAGGKSFKGCSNVVDL